MLRNNINVIVFSGNKKIMFKAVDTDFRGKIFKQVFVKIGNAPYKETGMTIEMGQQYWNVNKAMVEFISNAKDEGGVDIDVVDRLEGVPGITRVYIEHVPAVEMFMSNYDHFFTDRRAVVWKYGIGEIYNKTGYEARAYRRGVQTFYDDKLTSVYDYNFKEMNVNEDRSSSKSDFLSPLRSMINGMDVRHKQDILYALSGQSAHLPDAYIESRVELYWENPAQDWIDAVGERIVVTDGEKESFQEELQGKPYIVLPDNWVRFLKKHPQMPIIGSMLGRSAMEGWKETVPDKYADKIISDTTKFLKELGYDLLGSDVVVGENFEDSSVDGQVIEGKIYISTEVLKKGFDDTLAVISRELFRRLSNKYNSTDFEAWLIKENLYNMKRLHSMMEGK